MTESNSSETTHDPQLDRILADYVDAADAKGPQDREEWLRRYPAFAVPLGEFIDDHERFRRTVARAAGDLAVDSLHERTLLSGDSPAPTGIEPRIRYFGDYELLAEIARGGMGVVYRARQVSLNRHVAVKMILAGELASPEDVARFRAEAEAAANLDHPGIVPIYEIGQRDGQHYFSMKFIDGRSLADVLKADAALDSNRAIDATTIRDRVRLVVSVARAVHFAHQRGIIHRDLKPANILIDAAGEPHITDFGLAKSSSDESDLTQTGAIVGTPSYMAPEQARGGGKRATTAADIYGLGAILYATLTGRPPFEASTPLETLLRVQNDPPVPPRHHNRMIDPDLETICHKSLAKNPEERYRSAGELADDLQRWLDGEPIHAAPPSLTTLIGRWFATNFRSVACVLAIGAFTGLLVCEPVINVMAANLGPYHTIYEGAFPERPPPRMLEFLAAYPRIFGLAALPMLLIAYLGMGWLTDRLTKPTGASGALMAGLGVGVTAAIVAFLVGIGWEALMEVAVQPAQTDLRNLGDAIDGELIVGADIDRVLAKNYPQLTPDFYGRGRAVWKKAFADIAVQIPRALWLGFGFSVGILLLPATVQTLAANYLRLRGDRLFVQLLHFLEMTMPISLALASWGILLWDQPATALGFLVVPLLAAIAMPAIRRLPSRAQLVGLGGLAVATTIGLAWIIPPIFRQNSGGISFGIMVPAALATTVPIVQRWKWWARIPAHVVWIGALVLTGGLIQFRSAADAASLAKTQYVVSIASAALLIATVSVGLWFHRRLPDVT